jgi:transposase
VYPYIHLNQHKDKIMKKHIVNLTSDQRNQLLSLVASGKSEARKLTHARILLQSDSSDRGRNCRDEQISEALDVSLSTIARVRKRFVAEGLSSSLNPIPRQRHRRRILDGEGEAHLIALACSESPEGHDRWTLRLLAGKMVEQECVESISYETVRRTLKKTN